MVNLDRVLKSRHHLAYKGLYSQSYVFFQCSCTDIWVLNQREGWVPNNWCFWIVLLEKTLQSPLDSNKIKPVNPKRNQPWVFIGRTVAEAEVPILWPPDVKSLLIGKDPKCWERLRAKGEEGWQRTRWLENITNSMNMNLSKLRDSRGQRRLTYVHEVAKSWTQWLNNN